MIEVLTGQHYRIGVESKNVIKSVATKMPRTAPRRVDHYVVEIQDRFGFRIKRWPH